MGLFAKYWDDKASNEVVVKNITYNLITQTGTTKQLY